MRLVRRLDSLLVLLHEIGADRGQRRRILRLEADGFGQEPSFRSRWNVWNDSWYAWRNPNRPRDQLGLPLRQDEPGYRLPFLCELVRDVGLLDTLRLPEFWSWKKIQFCRSPVSPSGSRRTPTVPGSPARGTRFGVGKVDTAVKCTAVGGMDVPPWVDTARGPAHNRSGGCSAHNRQDLERQDG